MCPSNGDQTESFKALPLRQITLVCEAFDKEWSRSPGPDFQHYLMRVPEDSRVTLLRNLLHVDLRHRRDAGEHPHEDEYVQRLPQYSDVIREEFQPSTQNCVSIFHDTVINASPEKLASPSVVRLGDYVLERELGRGAMGIVFAARHIRHGARVALKTLPTVEGSELQRFKREFRSLADLNHPNLVGLHTLQADGGQWFFTMDLVDGEDFETYVRPQNQLDLARLRSAFSQLAIAVNALHGRHIVHRDIKPSNVMVSRAGELRVLDFGLVLDVTPLTEVPDGVEVGGTPAYMAPEQLSLQATTPASDWYAVGVMLYKALAGRLPFSGKASQILLAKQTSDPPPIPGTAPDDLAGLYRELLSRQPQDRPDAAEILKIICPDQVGHPTAAIESLPRERLLGRDAHFRTLENAIRSFEEQDEAHAVFISGRSGEGKTILAEHFLEQFRRDPAYTVLAGRCYDRESVPFKAVDMLIDALCAHLRSLPEAEVKGLLTADAAVLVDLFPVLSRVAAIARLPRIDLENLEVERVRWLAADALRTLVCRLSKMTRLVCFVDDLQWGDEDSAQLLLNVLRPPLGPHLLFIATYRSDEAVSSRFLQAWDIGKQQGEPSLLQTDCRLEPLSPEESVQLVVDIIGVDSEPVRQRAREMAKETGGNPFLLSELASCYDPQLEMSQPMQMEEVVERKLTLLPADARSLLDVVSVSGKAIPLVEAARTAGHISVPISTITHMRTERLLRMVGSDKDLSIDTYHDRIRETVLRDMNADTRKSLHIRLAEEIETAEGVWNENRSAVQGDATGSGDERVNPRVYDLAYHFFEGGDARAFGYQLRAGEAATRAYAMENALEHLTKAEQILPDSADERTRYRLWERLGEVCGKTQRLPQGLRYYERAEPFASASLEQAVVHDGIGEMYHRMGKFDNALDSFDMALRALGYRRPKWLPRVLLESSWLMSLCHLMWLVRPCRTAEGRGCAKHAADVFFRVAEIMVTKGDMLRLADAAARSTISALRSGNPEPIALGFGKLGFNSAAVSLQMHAKWIIARAMQFAVKCRDSRTKAVLDGYVGISSYCFGQLAEAESRLLKSLDVIDRLGESWTRIGLYHHLRHVYSVQGRSVEEAGAAEIECHIGEAASDPETICWGQYGLADAKARMGNLPEAHEHMRLSLAAIEGRGSTLSESVAYNHYGFVLLQSSDYVRAKEVLDQSRRIFERDLAYLEHVSRTYPWLVEALVGPDWLQSRKSAEMRRAQRLLRSARFWAWRYPNIRPHTLRVQGRLLCASDRRHKAKRCFERSVQSAGQLGAEYDLARSLLDLACVADERSDALRSEAVTILKRLKAVIPQAEKWQLGKDADPTCVAPLFNSP